MDIRKAILEITASIYSNILFYLCYYSLINFIKSIPKANDSKQVKLKTNKP